MTDITVCPSTLRKGYSSYSPMGLKDLFDGQKVSHILDFNIYEFRDTADIVEAMHRISVSGVQEKFSAIISDGHIRISQNDERSTHILKPAPWDRTLQNRKQIPANEHLTMQIASQIYGISTAANGLCFTLKGQPVYITRRFDITQDGTKLPMEDFATLIGRNEQSDGVQFKYHGSYEDIATAIRKTVPAYMVDIERFLELIVFNYIYANGDAHLKNFSIIRQGQDFRLAPAYDLLNTALHVNSDDLGLDGGLSPDIERSDVLESTGHPCRIDFERFARRIGVTEKRLTKILDKYMSIPDEAKTLIERSFLSDKMKRSYLRIITERTCRFIRISR